MPYYLIRIFIISRTTFQHLTCYTIRSYNTLIRLWCINSIFNTFNHILNLIFCFPYLLFITTTLKSLRCYTTSINTPMFTWNHLPFPLYISSNTLFLPIHQILQSIYRWLTPYIISIPLHIILSILPSPIITNMYNILLIISLILKITILLLTLIQHIYLPINNNIIFSPYFTSLINNRHLINR